MFFVILLLFSEDSPKCIGKSREPCKIFVFNTVWRDHFLPIAIPWLFPDKFCFFDTKTKFFDTDTVTTKNWDSEILPVRQRYKCLNAADTKANTKDKKTNTKRQIQNTKRQLQQGWAGTPERQSDRGRSAELPTDLYKVLHTKYTNTSMNKYK